MTSHAMHTGNQRGNFAPGGIPSGIMVQHTRQPIRFPRALKIGFWACIVIAVAVVIRRAVVLLTPPNPAAPLQLADPSASLDAAFAAHAGLTWFHILSALAFVLLLPLFFWHRTRGSALLQRAFFLLGIMVAGTAYAMNLYAVGGWLEQSAVLFFDTLFLASLFRTFLYARRGDAMRQQIWSLRAIAVLLGIATTRPVMGVFFAAAHLTCLTPRQFFGIAFWIGFSINTLAVELWLRKRALGNERIPL